MSGPRPRSASDTRSILNTLADELRPYDEEADVKHVLNKIFGELQHNCKRLQEEEATDDDGWYENRYSLDRTRIAGSMGKNTGIKCFSDYDCVVFINNREDADGFEDVLEHFEDIIGDIEDTSFQIYNDKIHRKEHSITFVVNIYGDEGNDSYDVKIDLLPAYNLLWRKNTVGLDVPLEQGKLVLQKITSYNNPVTVGKEFSTSLAEVQVAFVKSQTDFVIRAVRIAKFWNRTLTLVDKDGDSIYISGRSALIETVAIYAAREVEASPDGTAANKLFRAFKRFLTLMSNFQDLNVVMTDFIQKMGGTVPKFILDQASDGPLVLDPANPYNNLAHCTNIDEYDIGLFEEYAARTKDRLLEFRTDRNLFLHHVFTPQPYGEYEGKLGDLANIVLFENDSDSD